jgi:hypothetical protein
LQIFRANQLDMAHIYLASRLTDQWLGMRIYLLICYKTASDIDGKTVRGSRDGADTALHTISVYATVSGLCLGQKVSATGGGGEIGGIKALLGTLRLKGGHRHD